MSITSESSTCGRVKSSRCATSASALATSHAASRCATARSRGVRLRELAHERREELRLARRAPLLGVRHLVGERVELLAGEALAVGDRLLPPPRARRLLDVRARHFHVPTEDAGVAQLEARDRRRLAQARLEIDDHPLPVARQRARLVEVRVEAVADHVPVARARRHVVGDGAGEEIV